MKYAFRADGSYEWAAFQWGSRGFSCTPFYQHEEGTYQVEGSTLILRAASRWRSVQSKCTAKPYYLFGKATSFYYKWRIQTLNRKVFYFGIERVESLPTLILLPQPIAYERAPERRKFGVTALLSKLVYQAALLAVLASLGLLALYRRAVRRTMNTESCGVNNASEKCAEYRITTPDKLIPHSARYRPLADKAKSTSLYINLIQNRRRALAIYILAGVGYACASTIVMCLSAHFPFSLLRFLGLSVIFLWPTVVAVNLAASPEWSTTLKIASAYFALYAVVSVVVAAFSPHLTFMATPELWVTWALMSLPASAVCLALFNSRIRAVGPLVLSFMLFPLAGLASKSSAEYLSDRPLIFYNMLAVLGRSLPLGLTGLEAAMAMGIVALLGLVGWLGLRLIGYCYRRRRVSDQSIMFGALWLLFTFDQCFNSATDERGLSITWAFIAFSPFFVYLGLARLGLRLTRSNSNVSSESPRLLVLRVFALGNKSARMFRAIAKYWLYIGSIWHIAGPDLASSTVEPHEFLDFVSGRLARRFIDSSNTLELRLRETEITPGHDARFRVNDFFCHSDTWKDVLARLVRETDAVLMDLRGFSRRNSGCSFELKELVNVVPLARVVLITDDTTDQAHLDEVLQDIWQRMSSASPNRLSTLKDVRQFRFAGFGAKKYLQLVGVICAAAASAGTEEASVENLDCIRETSLAV